MWCSLCRPVTDEIIRLELEPALRALPPWRLEKALSYRFDKDRYTSAKAYLLLKELLAARYGMTEDVEFGYGPYGKPFLKSFPEIHFNFSHCPKAVFCAVADVPIGADVEEIQNDEEVAREVFSEYERTQIKNAEIPEIRFTEYWTRKESYLKLLGTGLTDDLKTLLYHPEPPVEFHTRTNPAIGVVSSVAVFSHH